MGFLGVAASGHPMAVYRGYLLFDVGHHDTGLSLHRSELECQYVT